MQTPPPLQAESCDHEYEPIASPTQQTMALQSAPVVRITDTDVVPVADSDESIDDNERCFPPKLYLDGDVVLPLDGQIEDSAMEGRELGETVDTSEDQESAQQMQDRLEEHFLNAATPCNESRTDAEVNTSQVDSSTLEELPLRRGARGIPQRLRSQAGKLRSRIQGIKRPAFSLPERHKSEKTKTTKAEKPKAEKPKVEKPKAAKAEKSKFSLPARPRFSMPDRPKFNFPDRSKFHMPERPKFTMPDKSKFSIKRPNINLPTLGRSRKPLRERQHSTESASGSKRNIFDFATYPRMFDKKSKNRGDYATSSPKASRAQSSVESATVPRANKKVSIGTRWAQRFTDLKFADDEPDKGVVESSKPWRHPSLEQPRLSLRGESTEENERMPWDQSEEQSHGQTEDIQYEEDSSEMGQHHISEPEEAYVVQAADLHEHIKSTERSFDQDPKHRVDPRLQEDESLEHEKEIEDEEEHDEDEYDEEDALHVRIDATTMKQIDDENMNPMHPKWRQESEEIPEADSYDRQDSMEVAHHDAYGRSFLPIDPRMYDLRDPREPSPDRESIHSDREQQSSGSSSDRRRRGVLEEINPDEFFLREKGISQDDVHVGRYLANEIRDALRSPPNALADHQDLDDVPPTRPTRTRSLRKRKDDSIESYNTVPPARPKRDRRRSEDSDCNSFSPDKAGSISGSRHRIIYQTDGNPLSLEPLDDIVVVKPERRKSRSTLRSYSELPDEAITPLHPVPAPPTPPVAPRRRRRGRREVEPKYLNSTESAVFNGHREWTESSRYPPEGILYPSDGMDYPPRGISYPPEVGESNPSESILNEDKLQTLVMRLDHEYIESAPVAPKRSSRSRATSVADDDRTSHGAESLPEGDYMEEDIPRDNDSRDLPGYAIIDKREKPPRPPPPRRRKDKFATTPRASAPAVPVRPQRAYSTLGPSRTRSLSDTQSQNQLDVTPYTELDSDDGESRDLRSGEVLSKMQSRPLPAPPRPPRIRREVTEQSGVVANGLVEVAVSTQTDPLPDDMIIEEEVTQAKLVMSPSRSGSQILVSTERIPTPTWRSSSPVVPPLPSSLRNERFTPSPTIPANPMGNVEPSVQSQEENVAHVRSSVSPVQLIQSSRLSEEPLRIASLEVGDLKVDRLSVSQLDAHKISASEVDAVVVSVSELSSLASLGENGLHPSLLRELIAIRSHLESVASTQPPRESSSESSLQVQSLKPIESTSLPSEEESTMIQKHEDTEVSLEVAKGNIGSTEESVEETPSVPTGEELCEALQESKLYPDSEEFGVSIENAAMEGPEIKVIESIVELTESEIELNGEETPEALQNEFLRAHNVTPDPESKVEETHAIISSPLSTPDESLPSLTSQHDPPEQTQSVQNLDNRPIKPERRRIQAHEYPKGGDRRSRSRSRSASPSMDGKLPVRQTATPVKSLPPVISVTPDDPDTIPSEVVPMEAHPQRATVTYSQESEEQPRRERSQSPQPSVPPGTQFVAFPTSQIPAHFFSLGSPVSSRFEPEPSIADMTQQLLRALRVAGIRAMRHFVGYVTSRVSSSEDPGEKTKEVELALCALLLLIAGLLILCFGTPRTVTQYHHWDYFNPPQ